MLAVGLTSCAKNDDENVDALNITVITKCQNADFWDTVNTGALDAGEELGININLVAPPTESDIDVEISLINDAISQGVDGILVGPLDTDLINDTLASAIQAGIHVVTIDSSVTYEGVSSFIGTQSETAGKVAGRESANILNEQGNIIVLSHMETAQTSIQRKQGFIDEIKNYPNISIVAELCGNNDVDYATTLLQEVLYQNDDVQLIYATNENMAVSACKVVESMGLSNTYVVGWDSSNTEIEYLNKGILAGMMVQNPYNFGYLGTRICYKAINGENVPSIVDTGVTWVTKDNINEVDVQSVLYPEKGNDYEK